MPERNEPVPLLFLFGLIACFAVVFACLVNIHSYSSTIAGAVCLFQYLWALKIACNDKDNRFPFAAFVFSGTFYLAMPSSIWGGRPMGRAIRMLQDLLHPPPEATPGRPSLFDGWQAWFNDAAMIGVALIISTIVLFAVSIRRR